MELGEFFQQVESSMLARFQAAGYVQHLGDRGENRESILRDFLNTHLPKKYSALMGQVITKDGKISHSADIIIYDALDCPVLYVEETAILPIEGVYGIIEVKSRLSKGEFVDAANKIESFKQLAPRDLSLIQTREYVTLHRASRPFGIVLGFEFADNSLDSLASNYEEACKRIHNVNYYPNLATVLGEGLIYFEKADLTIGEKAPLLDTDEFVNLRLTAEKRALNKEPPPEVFTRLLIDRHDEGTLGRFFMFLLIMLQRMKLGVPDLGRYMDPSLPLMIHRES